MGVMDYVDVDSPFEEKPLKPYSPLYTFYFPNCNSEAVDNSSRSFPLFNTVTRSPAVLSMEFVLYYLGNHPVSHIASG